MLVNRPIDVRDCGAYGDGLHDDASAIEAAIRLSALGSRCVKIPPGTYLVSRQILIDGFSGLRIVGGGMHITKLVEAPGAGHPVGCRGTLSIINSRRVEIGDLTIEADGSDSNDLQHKGIYANACPDLYVHNVEILGVGAEAIYTEGDSPRTRYLFNYVHDCALVGLNVNSSDSTSRDCLIHGNVVDNVKGAAILTAAESVTISNNLIRRATPGGSDLLCLSAASRHFIVSGNLITGADISYAAVALIAIGVSKPSLARGVVSGNVLLDNQVAGVGAGIGVRNVSGPVTISGNTIGGNGKAGTGSSCPAVRLSGDRLGKVAISGNHLIELDGIQTVGVKLDSGASSSGVTVGENVFDCTLPKDGLS